LNAQKLLAAALAATPAGAEDPEYIMQTGDIVVLLPHDRVGVFFDLGTYSDNDWRFSLMTQEQWDTGEGDALATIPVRTPALVAALVADAHLWGPNL